MHDSRFLLVAGPDALFNRPCMRRTFSFSWQRVAIALLLSCVAACFLFVYGRSLWHPIMVKIIGGKSVADRIAEITNHFPQLADLSINQVTLIGIKNPGHLDVFINGAHWQRFPFTAQSGTTGPKLRSGDGQIPEGLYSIDALNPNSSYHLSMRVSYPNDDDRARSAALGISELGGDIYIHGKQASIGCIAIGDDAIEQVFFVVHQCGYKNVRVIIAPTDLPTDPAGTNQHQALYSTIKEALAPYYR
jgi:murein L,D-transpeptidase YafK